MLHNQLHAAGAQLASVILNKQHGAIIKVCIGLCCGIGIHDCLQCPEFRMKWLIFWRFSSISGDF